MSTVKPAIHTNPGKLCTENGAFNFENTPKKTTAFRFSVDGKHFENDAFPK